MRRAEERAERTAAMETEAAMQAAADWVRDNDHVDLAELDTEIARLQVCASLQTGQYRVGNTPLTRLQLANRKKHDASGARGGCRRKTGWCPGSATFKFSGRFNSVINRA